MPKIQHTPTGQVRRVIVPSSICNGCKGTGRLRRADGTETVHTNCQGKGRFDFGR